MGNPKIEPCKYDQVIFDKGYKVIQWRKYVSFRIKGSRTSGHP